MFLLRGHDGPVSGGRWRPQARDVRALPGRPAATEPTSWRPPTTRAIPTCIGRVRCALYQEFWGGALEPHKAQQHPGWTATFEILQRYLRQRLRVIYRRASDRGPGEGGGLAPS